VCCDVVADDRRPDRGGRVFDLIAGLPLHALVVHAVVVLLPLTVLGAVAIALVPRWSRRFGVLVVVGAVVSLIASYVAVESGEQLATRVGTPQAHFDIARWLPWFALVLLLLVGALWLIDRRADRDDHRVGNRRDVAARTGGTKVLAALTVAVAVAALVWTVRPGDSGARAVWGPIVDNTVPGSQPLG
jgi:hypothetical protein